MVAGRNATAGLPRQRPMLPADGPVLGLAADVQGSSGVRVVQVQCGRGGVSARRVQTDGLVKGCQTFDLLQTKQKPVAQFVHDMKH